MIFNQCQHMGKGDKKTKRGKIAKGTYGVRRKKKEKNVPVPPSPEKVKKG
jgi:ribosomal small subunit protein bTHX